MKTWNQAVQRLALIVLAALVVALTVAQSAQAAVVSINNTGGNLDANASWVGGVAPGINDIAQWDNNVTSVSSWSMGTGANDWGGIKILNPGGGSIFIANNSIKTRASGIDMSAATVNMTFTSCGLTLNASQDWNVAAGRALTLVGVTAGSFTPTIKGAGSVTISPGSSLNSTGGGLTLDPSFTGLMLFGQGNGYSGATTVNNGWLRCIGANTVSAFGSGALILAGGTIEFGNDNGGGSGMYNRNTTVSADGPTIVLERSSVGNGLDYTMGTLNVSGAYQLNLRAGGWVSGGAAVLKFTGTSFSGNPTFNIINPGAAGATTTLTLGAITLGNTIVVKGSGLLTQSAAWVTGSGGVTLDSTYTGTTTLSQANTFTGPVIINGGTLAANGNATALGTAGATLQMSGGTLDLNNGSGLAFGRNTTISGNATIIPEKSGAGTGVTYTLGTLSIGAYQLNVTGGNVNGAPAATLSFGTTTLTGSPTLNIVNPTAGGSTLLTLDAITESPAGQSLTKTGSGSLTLTGNSTYTGTTSLSKGTVTLAGSTARISGTTGITLNGVTLQLTNVNGTEGALDRVNNAAGITSQGGMIKYTNTSGYNYAETLGALSYSRGHLTISSDTQMGAANTSVLTLGAGSLSHSGSTVTVGFVGANLGVSGTQNSILISSESATAASKIIGPWALYGTDTSTYRVTDYAVYDATKGIVARAATAAGTDSAWSLTWADTSNYALSAGTLLTATRNINSLRHTNGSTSTLALGAYSLNTYGILNGGGNPLTLSSTGGAGVGLSTPTGGDYTLYLIAGNNSIILDNTAKIVDNGSAVKVVVAGSGGTVNLNAASTYTGGTTLNSGTLNINNNNALGTGSLTINGGTINTTGVTLPNNAQNWNSDFTFTGGAALAAGSGAVTLGANVTVTASANTLTVGAIGGAFGLTKAGAGTLTISSGGTASSFTGDLNISAGTLKPAAAGVLPNGPGKGNVTVTGTLDLNGLSQTVNGLSGAGTVAGTSGTPTLTVGNNDASSTFSGIINNAAGALTLIKTGTGTLTLMGNASTFGGGLTIDGGTVIAGVRASGTGASALGRPDLARNITINNGGTLSFAASFATIPGDAATQNTTPTYTFVINANGLLTCANAIGRNDFGPIVLNGGTLTTGNGFGPADPSVNLRPSTVTVGGSSASTISAGGSVFNAVGLANSTTFTVADATGDSSADLIVSAKLANAAGGNGGSVSGTLIKAGPGTMALNGINTYSGATTVNAGTLLINAVNSVASTVTVGGNGTTGTPTLSGTGKAAGNVTINGPGTGVAGTIAGSNGSTFTVGGNLTLSSGSKSTFNLSGAPGGALVAVVGTLSTSGNTITIPTVTQAGTYHLFSYTSATLSTGFTMAGSGNAIGYNFAIQYNGTSPKYVDVVVTESSGPATKLVITGSGSQTAGGSQNLTITAKDAGGNTAISYTGAKTLTFSGASSSVDPVTVPTVTDNTGTPVDFGTATTITFVNGEATVGGSMTLYKAEAATISVTDQTLSSSGGDNLSVTVSPNTASKLVVTSVPVSATAGANFSVTVQSQDAYGNAANVSGNTGVALSASGSGTLSGNTGTISAGANGTTLSSVQYTKAESITLTAARTSGDSLSTSAASSSFTVGAGVASKLVVTSVPGSATAGANFLVTVQAHDANGNPANVSGNTDISLSASGAGTLSGNMDTITAGANSVTLSAVQYTKSESITLTAARTSGDSLSPSAASSSVVVSAGAVDATTVETEADGSGSVVGAQSVETGNSITVFAVTRDAHGNFVANPSATIWSLVDISGGVVSGDLFGTAGSAVFTGGAAGSAKIQAVADSLTGQSGLLTVTVGAATRLVITGSGSQTAGASQDLTITAVNNDGNTDANYTGTHYLNFFGAGSSGNPVTAPTVMNSSGTAVAFGSPTAIDFVDGEATVSGGNNGAMALYKVESVTISAEDPAFSIPASSGGDRLSVTVSEGDMSKFALSLTSPQVNGVAFTGANTLTAQDAYGNTITSYDASANHVTLAAVAPLTGAISGLSGGNVLNGAGDFVSGVANLTTLGMVYTGNASSGTFTATAATGGYTGTSGSVTINAGTASKLVITGSGAQTAGASQDLTITAKDASGNTATGYAGSKSLIFSGATSSASPVTAPTVKNSSGTAVAFGAATAINFVSGVATVSGVNNGAMVLYKAESVTISAEDPANSIPASSGGDRLSVAVSAGGVSKFALSLTSPQVNGVAFTGGNTLTAQDAYGNTVTSFDASANNVTIAAVSPLTGAVSGLSGASKLTSAGDFSAGVANLTALGLTYTGNAASGTFTATAATGGAMGTSGSVTIGVGAAVATTVENAANGGGSVVGAQSVQLGSSLTVYAITRDASGNFVGNPSATWSLVNVTPDVVSGDLAGGGASAVFTGNGLGSARIQAVASGFTGQSGLLTVTDLPRTVSINFGSDVQTLSAGESAGAVVSAANWNNVSGATGSASGMQYGDGSASGVSVRWAGFGGTWSARGSGSNGDEKMMRGYADNSVDNGAIVVTGIQATDYDVYVYFGSDNDNLTGSVGLNGAEKYYYKTFSKARAFPALYTLTTDTVGSTPPSANYAKWVNRTASSFTLTFTKIGNNSGVHGIQIVTRGTASTVTTRSVGLNFGSDRKAMTSGDAAGAVETFANWNNLSGNSPSSSSLFFNDGMTLSGISLAASNFEGTYLSRNFFGNDDSMMWGYLDNTGGSGTIQVNSIPACDSYDVYVYFASDTDGRSGKVGIGGAATYSYKSYGNVNHDCPASYVPTTDTGTGYPNANYAKWSGMTAANFTMTFDYISLGGSGPCGMQILLHTYVTTTTLTRHAGTEPASTYGDVLSFDISVAGTSGSAPTPTGTVTLKNGGTTLGSGTLSDGTCQITLANDALTPGSYSGLVAVYSGDTSCDASSSALLSPAQVVAQKELTVTGASVTTKTYDRNRNATITGATLAGTVGADDVVLANATTGTFDTKDIGVGKAVATAPMTITGADMGNYTLTQPVLTGTIDAKALTVTGAVAQNKVHDGNNVAQITGAGLSGVIAPDVVALANHTVGTFAQVEIGVNIAVSTAPMTLAGADAGNYTLTQPTGLHADILRPATTLILFK